MKIASFLNAVYRKYATFEAGWTLSDTVRLEINKMQISPLNTHNLKKPMVPLYELVYSNEPCGAIYWRGFLPRGIWNEAILDVRFKEAANALQQAKSVVTQSLEDREIQHYHLGGSLPAFDTI